MSSTTWKSSPISLPNARHGGLIVDPGHGHAETEADRRGEEPAGLQSVELREVVVVACDVAVLAADHPERRLDELARDPGVVVGEREPHRLGEQRVAGEQRHAFPECDVRARPAAALGIVVQRRQVVVHEREGVHELERGCRGKRLLHVSARRLDDGEAEHRANALTRDSSE